MKKFIAPLGAIALLLTIGVPTLAQTTTANVVKSAVVSQDKMTPKKPVKKTAMKKKMPMKGKKMAMKKKMPTKGKMTGSKMSKDKMSK